MKKTAVVRPVALGDVVSRVGLGVCSLWTTTDGLTRLRNDRDDRDEHDEDNSDVGPS